MTAVALTALVSACGASGESPAGTPALADASPEPPATTFTFTGEEPVVSRAMTRIQDSFINPGAVIEHEGELHMFANLFTAFPGRSRIAHLTSADGEEWALAGRRPVFSSDQVEYAETGAQVSAGFVTADGTWVLIFQTLSSIDPWRLGRATAPAPDGPWTVDPDPILEPGPEGSLDAGGLSWPSVVRTNEGYRMYYTARPDQGADGVIAMATSQDGAAWTKADEPALTAASGWEDGSVDRPRVTVVPSGFVMVYSGRDLTDRGVAFSTDGVSWQRDGDAPAISEEDFPVDGRCWDAALLHRDGRLLYILEIGSPTAARGTELYLATAPLP
jgi:predicted GH43/DUF377 family glycosyl hydrolase